MSNQDLRQQLAEILDEAEWEWLIPHAQRDAIIVVAPELDLLDVGEAIANDNTSSVNHWINEALISKPSPIQLSEWNSDHNKKFSTLIIQPYVLVQEITA
jgi:hypothetical protein